MEKIYFNYFAKQKSTLEFKLFGTDSHDEGRLVVLPAPPPSTPSWCPRTDRQPPLAAAPGSVDPGQSYPPACQPVTRVQLLLLDVQANTDLRVVEPLVLPQLQLREHLATVLHLLLLPQHLPASHQLLVSIPATIICGRRGI